MGRTALLVLSAEVVNNVGLELPLHVEDVVGNAQAVADDTGVVHVVHGAAAPVVVGQVGLVQAVELHGDAHHIITLPLQKQGGHRGIYAAAHRDDYSVALRSCHSEISVPYGTKGDKDGGVRQILAHGAGEVRRLL